MNYRREKEDHGSTGGINSEEISSESDSVTERSTRRNLENCEVRSHV